MKTAAKVFIWIGMILQFFLIYPIVLGIFALKKINSATSKDELQTQGIFTTLFCSLLGGIFMLCIKDEELNGAISPSNNGVIVYRKKHITYERNENIDPIKQKAHKAIKALLYSLIGVFALSILFSIAATIDYNGESYIPLILVGISFVLYTVTMVFFIIRKHTLSRLTNVLLIIIGVVSIYLSILSAVTNYSLAWSIEWYNGETYHAYGEGWEYWCLFAFGLVLTGIVGIALFLSIKTKQKDLINGATVVKKVTYTETSNVEIELAEAKRLLDTKIITEEEYQNIRKGILNKYYSATI